MTYHLFSNFVMIQVSQHWIKPDSPARLILLSDRRFAALVPDVDESVTLLVASEPGAGDPVLVALNAQVTQFEHVYDDKGRTLHSGLDWAARATGNAEFTRVKTLFFPQGLSHLVQSYRDEGGHAIVVSERVTPADHQLMQSVSAQGISLDTVACEHLDAGIKLAEAENRRTALSPSERPSTKQSSEARRRWVLVVRTLEATADVAGLDEEQRQTLFGPLYDAARDASRRRRVKAQSSGSESESEISTESPSVAEESAPAETAAITEPSDGDASATEGAPDSEVA
jgi:hypothetical protein